MVFGWLGSAPPAMLSRPLSSEEALQAPTVRPHAGALREELYEALPTSTVTTSPPGKVSAYEPDAGTGMRDVSARKPSAIRPISEFYASTLTRA
jgi:hypothetical protein